MPVAEKDNPPAALAMKSTPRYNTTMFQIFDNVQYNVVQHKKYVKEMTKLYKKLDDKEFRESFKNALLYLFTFGDTSANVDRVIQFVATFCTSLDDEEEFLMFIFDIIFECQCVSGQSVRYRAGQLLAAVLFALGEDASLDDDLCDKLLTSQMQRLQDTRGAVRCRAALALQRLQNPMDPDDEVTRAYRFHMSCDPSSSVRRAIVMSIAKCTRNVPFVLERLRDVDEAVRRAAFLHIAAINVTQLRVRQRVLTLKVGLTERSQRVRRVVEEILIPGWLSTFKGNIIDLLKAIRLDNANDAKDSEYVAKKLLESLFKRLPVSELLVWLPINKSLRLIPAENLNKETAWYWRHLVEHLHKIDDDTLETVLPDLIVFTGYIRAIVQSPCPTEEDDPVQFGTRQSVLRELAVALRLYDAADPPGRADLRSLINDVLTGDYGPMFPEVIREFVYALEMVMPDVTQRIEVVYRIITALRDPPDPDEPPAPVALQSVDSMEVKLQRARLRVSLNVAMEAQEDAVREQNYDLAAKCKAKVEDIQKKLDDLNVQVMPPPPPVPVVKEKEEKLSDPVTLNKCLTILNCALDTPQIKTITPMLKMIFSELEVEIFENPDILKNSLETVALYAMIDKEYVKENKAFFFAHLLDTSNEAIVSTVLRCIADLLCVHGARVFDEDAIEDATATTTVTESRRNDSAFERSKQRSTYRSTLDEDGNISESALSMSPSHGTVIELLLKLMDSTCAAYRLIIVEGLCRLFYLGHLESSTILSRLILLWFNPATVDEDELRQVIGVFFEVFPASVDGAQEQIQKAILPTLRALANAPASSPLCEVDQESVVRFLVSLTRVNQELTDSQGAMAVTLCSELVRRPESAEAGLVCRMLALLAPPRDAHVAADLAHSLRDLCLKLPDKQSCRNLTRYLGALEATERASLNKMSNTGMTEGTMQNDDTNTTNDMMQIGRITTSLPHPIARSTHVVINETLKEEIEIDETSPDDVTEKTSPAPQQVGNSPERVARSSNSDTGPVADSIPSDPDQSDSPTDKRDATNSDSSEASPVKKAKITKGKKKKLSMKRKSESESSVSRGKNKDKDKQGTSKDKGVKRTRSQRSLVGSDKAQNTKHQSTETQKARTETSSSDSGKSVPTKNAGKRKNNGQKIEAQKANTQSTDIEKTKTETKKKRGKSQKPSPEDIKTSPEDTSSHDFDISNVNVRRTRRSCGSGSDSGRSAPNKNAGKRKNNEKKKEEPKPSSMSARSSTGSERTSRGSVFEDSAEETQLHTIVYDNDFEQSVLEDSTLVDSKQASKANVTVPETPDDSDESESEP